MRRSSRKLSPALTISYPATGVRESPAHPGAQVRHRHLALIDVKATAKLLGATINDMVLAISTGALRTLLLRYDGKGQPLRRRSVSYDFSPERISGSASPGMLVALPAGSTDPLQRVRVCHENAVSPRRATSFGTVDQPHRRRPATSAGAEALFRSLSGATGEQRYSADISDVGPRERVRVKSPRWSPDLSVGPLTAGSG